MPFESEAQRRFMYAAEARGEVPKGTAARWQKHTKGKKLPERKTPTKEAGEYTPAGARSMLAAMDREVRGGPIVKDTKTVKEEPMNTKCGAVERIFFGTPASESQKDLAEKIAAFTKKMNPEKLANEKAVITDELIEEAFRKRASQLTRGERYAFQFAPVDAFAQ